MRKLLTRTIGIALIIAGVTGLVLAIAGLLVLIRVEDNILSTAREQVGLLEQALSATSEGLDIAQVSLEQAVTTIETLESTVAGIGDAVGSSVPAVEGIASLVGVQLPATIETTQQTLESVAESAKTVDDLLVVISAAPLLGATEYSPDVPLSQGFQDVAESLEGIPDSLRLTGEQLLATTQSLQGVQDSLGIMTDDIGDIATSVGQAQSVLEQYEDVTAQLQTSTSWISDSLPSWVYWLRLGLSLLLVWLGIAQFALITQGWELVGRSRHSSPVEEPVPNP